MITWTLFKDESREVFRTQLSYDEDTWMRARGWTLWKAMMYIVKNRTSMNFEAHHAWNIIDEVLND